MAKELFDLGFNGVTHSKGYEEDGKIVLVETMPGDNVQTVIDQNKAQATGFKDKLKSPHDLGVLGARIDIATYHNWRTEWKQGPKLWGTPWHKFLKAKLNDPNYKHLRFMNL